MTLLHTSKKLGLIGAALLTLTASSYAGCANFDSEAHSDFITCDAGDSIAANLATQRAEAWPRNAQNTDLDTSGKRAAAAVQRYYDNKVIPPRSLNSTSGSFSNSNGEQLSATIQK